MTALSQAVEDYLELRRGLGFKLREYGECLHEFVSFLSERGALIGERSFRNLFFASRVFDERAVLLRLPIARASDDEVR